MSGGDDDPPDPNRTVFRPSPLQSHRAQGEAPPAGTVYQPAPGAPPPSTAGPAAGAVAPARLTDDDVPRPTTPPRVRNPIIAEAAPLLALAAAVRSGRAAVPLPELHRQASADLSAYTAALGAYPPEVQQRARYAVAATLDDIAQNLPGGAADGAEWARRSLVVQAFGEAIGGERFWQLLEEMLARPAEYEALIELYHACLAAGFEGRYRVAPDGRSRLQEIMARAYSALPHVRELSQTELSRRWRGRPTPVGRVGLWAPLAFAGGAAALLLLLAYLGFRLALGQAGAPALAALHGLNPAEPLRLSRAAAPPPAPPPSAQLLRLQGFLAPEIAQGLVKVEQDAATIRVRTTVGQLFRPGSDQLDPGRRGLFERIGAALETQPGPVMVEGHADNTPIAGVTFPDNLALSKARAQTVAEVLKSKVSNPSRISAEGFGDTQAIASNATPDGRALNRRVEIVVQRSE